MEEKKREAKAAVDLMRETFTRVRSEEEAKKGLVIVKALYGHFINPVETRSEEEESTTVDEVIDVMIPLQCLVKDSKLILQEASKVNVIQVTEISYSLKTK